MTLTIDEGSQIDPVDIIKVEEQLERFKGAHFINIQVRINGEDRSYEGDWLLKDALPALVEFARREGVWLS